MSDATNTSMKVVNVSMKSVQNRSLQNRDQTENTVHANPSKTECDTQNPDSSNKCEKSLKPSDDTDFGKKPPDSIQTDSNNADGAHQAPKKSTDNVNQRNKSKLSSEKASESGSARNDRREINILLLGPSGIGKSTFINALVNFCKFNELRVAEKKSVAVIPISFMLAVGHDFTEKQIKFGETDSNEDHQNSGQSVTQECRSYLISIKKSIYLRIIDTPGVNDTRGVEHDERNIKMIQEFMMNISHIDAVCILLKPNESKLPIALSLYFTELLPFFGEEIFQNLLFCFTNSRLTFYKPGETIHSLKKLLHQCKMTKIQINFQRMFCFDSESFRYLMAVRSGVTFLNEDFDEYEQSWKISHTETQRFLQYLIDNENIFKKRQWRSFEHFRLLMNDMALPIVESMHHYFRNLTLQVYKSEKEAYIKHQCQPLEKQLYVNYDTVKETKAYFGGKIFVHHPSEYDNSERTNEKVEKALYRCEYTEVSEVSADIIQMTERDFQALRKIVYDLFEKADDQIVAKILYYLKVAVNCEKQIGKTNKNNINYTISTNICKLRDQLKSIYSGKNLLGNTKDLENLYKLLDDAGKLETVDEKVQCLLLTRKRLLKLQEKSIKV